MEYINGSWVSGSLVLSWGRLSHVQCSRIKSFVRMYYNDSLKGIILIDGFVSYYVKAFHPVRVAQFFLATEDINY